MNKLSFRSGRGAGLLAAAIGGMLLAQLAVAADGAVALDKAPQTPAMAESVVTVDTLIRSENLQALVRARDQLVAAGLTQPEPAKPSASGPVVRQLVIGSIYGIESDLRSNLVFGSDVYERVRVGAHLGDCIVASISPREVALKPGRKGVAATACPKARWTGVPPVTAMTMAPMDITKGGSARGGAMPSPAVPTPYSSLGAPSGPIGTPGTPALKVDRPTVQLIPAGPVAPGQTSIPLVARQLEPTQAPTN